MLESWTRVGRRDELRDGLNSVRVSATAVVIAVLEDKLLAFSGFCPHMNGPMVRSEVEGLVVSCPLHGWRFDLADGGRELHGYRCLRTFPVRRIDADVFINLSTQDQS